MPFNGSGTYNLPGAALVDGQTVSAPEHNTFRNDVATALTNTITRDGQSPATANLPMGGFKHTNVADASLLTDYLTAKQSLNSSMQYLSSVSGSNTITANSSISPTAYAAGQTFNFIAVANNTGAVTINISGLGAKNIYKRNSGGNVALTSGDIVSGQVYTIIYDGTQFELIQQRAYSQGADIASASTVNLDTSTGDYVTITGTTTITAITLSQGEQRTVRFSGILTLTNGASLILPSGANITTAAGDVATFRGEASGVVRCVSYTLANGKALIVDPFPVVPQLQRITASVASNAITVSASALSLDFRSTTLPSGAVTPLTGTPASLTIAATDSFGLVTAAGNQRIPILAINAAGTIELAAGLLAGGVSLDETGLITTVTAATTATQIKSTTARTNVAYRVVGFLDAPFTTGTGWGSLALVQGVGGQALAAMSSLGYGQTRQDVSGSRALSTTYYNTTGKPIFVEFGPNSGSTITVTVNGVGAAFAAGAFNVSFIVPVGQSYSIASSNPLLRWFETR